MRLSDEDRTRVAAAITAAEAGTDAEIAVIAAARSDEYRDAGLHWTVLAMLLLLAAQGAVPGHFAPLLSLVPGVSPWGGEPSTGDLIGLAALLAALVFLAGQAVFRGGASAGARSCCSARAWKRAPRAAWACSCTCRSGNGARRSWRTAR